MNKYGRSKLFKVCLYCSRSFVFEDGVQVQTCREKHGAPVGECAAVHAGRVTDDETVHGVVFTKELKF
jgi:hypothetical protein